MKKIFRLILISFISLTLVNCGENEDASVEDTVEQKVQNAAPYEKKPATVIIPNANVSVESTNNDKKSTAESGTITMVPYTIKSGDSLSQIAEDNNTTVEELAKINKITDTYKILVDQIILVPTKSMTSNKPSNEDKTTNTNTSKETKTYTVQDGDSGYSIALAHDISLEKFAEINGKTIEELNLLYVGDEVLVPR